MNPSDLSTFVVLARELLVKRGDLVVCGPQAIPRRVVFVYKNGDVAIQT